MSTKEISELSERLDDTHPRFDVKLVAQIAKWIHTVGPKYVSKWPNLEYQGPMYWKLAHTSMSRWQKIAVLALTVQNERGPFKGWNSEKRAFLWSEVEESLRHKKEYESKDYRDASTVKAFFETYCDTSGKKIFEVEATENNTLQDFWIKPLEELKKIHGAISLNNEGANGKMELERPPGLSEYQWKKMQKKFNEEKRGLKNAKDSDLL